MTHAETARVTTFVSVSPQDAFAAFTEQIDLWWRRGPRYRMLRGDDSVLHFERDRTGRRLIERLGEQVFEIGRVLHWEPGRRLVFEWKAPNFAPDDCTEVEVRFETSGKGTRVTLEHRGWDAIRSDHPVRHGQQGSAFSARIGANWGQHLGVYRLLANGTAPRDR